MGYKIVNDYYTPADLKSKARKAIIENLELERGDIVAFISQEDTYRNSGKAIFNGEDIVKLYYDEDDYGSVPPTFFVGGEFPIIV